MTPKELYPIGTQLITRRLSQSALCDEIFCWKTIESCVPGGWAKGFSIYGRDRDDYITQWRVTVTAENQKWLSPVPMVGDWVETFDGMIQVLESAGDEVGFERKGILYFWENEPIVLRTYPDGQRAPLIAFDEVILPTKEKQS
jgi:hypothetical protein